MHEGVLLCSEGAAEACPPPLYFDPPSSEMHDGEEVCYTVDKVTFDL